MAEGNLDLNIIDTTVGGQSIFSRRGNKVSRTRCKLDKGIGKPAVF